MTPKQEIKQLLKYYIYYLVIFSLVVIPLLMSCDDGFTGNLAKIQQWSIGFWLAVGTTYLALATALFIVVGRLIAMDGV